MKSVLVESEKKTVELAPTFGESPLSRPLFKCHSSSSLRRSWPRVRLEPPGNDATVQVESQAGRDSRSKKDSSIIVTRGLEASTRACCLSYLCGIVGDISGEKRASTC